VDLAPETIFITYLCGVVERKKRRRKEGREKAFAYKFVWPAGYHSTF